MPWKLGNKKPTPEAWMNLDKASIPMKLCNICSQLNWTVLSHRTPLKHQPSFTALLTASKECEMCLMFLDGVRVRSWYSDEQFKAVESQGRSQCLIEGNGSSIKYWIPKSLEGPMDWMSGAGVMEVFDLSNCYGFEDERINRTELTPLPNFDIARGWVRECISDHPKCKIKRNGDKVKDFEESLSICPRLPTRVINVGGKNGDKEPQLMISGDTRAEYVTLSYCWGKVTPLRTESSNFQQHLKSIPLLSMPRTLQDAVTTTRELGFRYLWIDSLCIIQDSVEDWDRECSKMSSIYLNSALTISGAEAFDSSVSFISERVPPPRSFLWEYTNPGETCSKRTILRTNSPPGASLYDQDYPHCPVLTRREDASPLRSRGWILQENLLSTRMLFFGSYRMHWQCNTCVQFEDFPRKSGHSKVRLHCTTLTPPNTEPLSKAPRSFESRYWYSIIEEFTLRSLTKRSDKLPALSGIAAWTLHGRGEFYLAGLLMHDLHGSLASKVNPKTAKKRKVRKNRGPSWSWASNNHAVVFPAASAYNVHANCSVKGPVKFFDKEPASSSDEESDTSSVEEAVSVSDKESTTSSVKTPFSLRDKESSISFDKDWVTRKFRMRIHDAQVKLRGENVFGEVKSGSVKLKGRVTNGLVTYETRCSPFFHFDDPQSPGSDRIDAFYPDDIHHWRELAKQELKRQIKKQKEEKEREEAEKEEEEEDEEDEELLAMWGIIKHKKKSSSSSISSTSSGDISKSCFSLPLQETKCVYIGKFGGSCFALAIEPIISSASSVLSPPSTTSGPAVHYQPHRRVGFIEIGFFNSTQYRFNKNEEIRKWIKDAQWEYIELL